MNTSDIALQRLENHLVSHSDVIIPSEVVHRMVALQAQDYYASLWGIGLRVAGTITEEEVEQAVSERKIVRTWPMRGTLHFAASEDAKWMLKLLTPRVIKSSAGRHKQLELDKSVFNKSRKLLEKHLQGEVSLTRPELYRILDENGISTEGQRGYHIIRHLAQNAVICFGCRRGKQHTFVLFDEWIPKSKNLIRDEALAELASRYIHSRGPVTEYDFAAWAGLTVSSARNSFKMIETEFEKKEITGQTYWFPEPVDSSHNKSPVHLLPGFDEMICGYKDLSAILEPGRKKSVILKNGILKPVIITNGKIIGSWKRTLKTNTVKIKLKPFTKLTQKQQKIAIEKGVEYAKFLKLEPEFEFEK